MDFIRIINFNKKECEEIANIILEANKNTILAQIITNPSKKTRKNFKSWVFVFLTNFGGL